MRYVVFGTQIFEFKGLKGKILETKDLALEDLLRLQFPLIDMVGPVLR